MVIWLHEIPLSMAVKVKAFRLTSLCPFWMQRLGFVVWVSVKLDLMIRGRTPYVVSLRTDWLTFPSTRPSFQPHELASGRDCLELEKADAGTVWNKKPAVYSMKWQERLIPALSYPRLVDAGRCSRNPCTHNAVNIPPAPTSTFIIIKRIQIRQR